MDKRICALCVDEDVSCISYYDKNEKFKFCRWHWTSDKQVQSLLKIAKRASKEKLNVRVTCSNYKITPYGVIASYDFWGNPTKSVVKHPVKKTLYRVYSDYISVNGSLAKTAISSGRLNTDEVYKAYLETCYPPQGAYILPQKCRDYISEKEAMEAVEAMSFRTERIEGGPSCVFCRVAYIEELEINDVGEAETNIIYFKCESEVE